MIGSTLFVLGAALAAIELASTMWVAMPVLFMFQRARPSLLALT